MRTKEVFKSKIYGAYGSNLNIIQMGWRCRFASRHITGYVNDYKLTFRRNGYANIEPSEGDKVPVLLWKVTAPDEAALDRYEGYPRFYTKVTLPVETTDGIVEAMFYIMTPQHIGSFEPPRRDYLETIIEGYQSNGLPLEYLKNSLGI